MGLYVWIKTADDGGKLLDEEDESIYVVVEIFHGQHD